MKWTVLQRSGGSWPGSWRMTCPISSWCLKKTSRYSGETSNCCSWLCPSSIYLGRWQRTEQVNEISSLIQLLLFGCGARVHFLLEGKESEVSENAVNHWLSPTARLSSPGSGRAKSQDLAKWDLRWAPSLKADPCVTGQRGRLSSRPRLAAPERFEELQSVCRAD